MSDKDTSEKQEYRVTIYDDVWRTMVHDFPQLLVAFVNELFGEQYPDDAAVVFLQDTQEQSTPDGNLEKRITDSHFCIESADGSKKYFHIECQSNADSSMLVRMFEYDSQIALDHAKTSTDKLVVAFPHAGIIYLRSNSSTPDKMTVEIQTPGGSVEYCVRVAKMQSYSVKELFTKRLLLLLPFYMFIVEKGLAQCECDQDKMLELKSSLQFIVAELYAMQSAGEIDELTKRAILELSNRINRQLTHKYQLVQKEAEAIMGGKVLEYEAKTIYRRGIAEGIATGKAEGIATGRAEGEINIIRGIMKTRAITAEEAMKMAGISQQDFGKYIGML